MTPSHVAFPVTVGDLRQIGAGRVAGGRLGQAEVEDLHDAVGLNHDVAGLEVAMDDALFVRRVQRVGDLTRDVERVSEIQRPRPATVRREAVGLRTLSEGCARPAPTARSRDDVGQRLPRHQLHDERLDAVAFLQPVDLRDVRMIERRQQARFARKPSAAVGVGRQVRRQHFDGDVAPELRVARAIDLAHAAGTDPRLDQVDAEPASGQVSR